MSDKKRKLLKQTSIENFMCGSFQSKRQKTDMNSEQKEAVKHAAEKREKKQKEQQNEKSENASSASEATPYEPEPNYDKSKTKNRNKAPNDQMEEDEFIPKKKPNKTDQHCRSFKGVPIASLNSAPACIKNVEKIKAGKNHTVLFKCPFVYDGKNIPTPHPSSYKDKWDNNHVRMPCSNSNEYPVDGEHGTELKRRWVMIEEAYKDIIPGPFELEMCFKLSAFSMKLGMTTHLNDFGGIGYAPMCQNWLVQEAILSYNQRYKSRWDFGAFRKFFLEFLLTKDKEHFFEHTLPKIIKLALALPSLCTQPIPLLKRYANHSISLSQQQIACLLANAFLCTFPRRNSRQKGSEYANYPDINLNGLFQSGGKSRKFQKLKCIVHYFERITTKMPCGVVTFTRQYIEKTPSWDDVKLLVPEKIHVSSQGTIEDDGFGLLQVDFANKYIGGGVLGHGCVQEEIRFLICPEMLVTRLFTEVLDDKESLIMKGCERFSDYEGYADSFMWAGNCEDMVSRDVNGRLYTDVVAIDALVIQYPSDQFKSRMVKRELTKAYVGFEVVNDDGKTSSRPAVCTGNWGCGAFRGDKQLKALIQLMAASVAQRDVCYFTFGDDKLTHDIHQIHSFLRESETEIGVLMLTIEGYYRKVCQSYRRRKKKVGLYEYIFESFEGINHSESEEEWEELVVPEDQGADANNSHDVHDSSRENSIDCIDLSDDQMDDFKPPDGTTTDNIKLTYKDEMSKNEKSEDEKSENEKSEDAKSENEKSENEKSEDAKSENEKSEDAKSEGAIDIDNSSSADPDKRATRSSTSPTKSHVDNNQD